MSNLNFIYINNRNAEAEKAKLQQLKNDGYTVIGLEMTDDDLSQICDKNIDPQHTGGMASVCCAKLIAEKAPELLGWFKSKDLDKVMFVTDRVDVDSVAAYILAMRYLKGEKVALNENIEAINTHDTGAKEPWQGAKPIEKAFDPENKAGALAASIKVFMVTEQNIADVATFVDSGKVSEANMERFAISQQAIIAKVKSGEIQVEVSHGIAFVSSTERAATDVGYAFAPVVVAFNPKMSRADKTTYKKWTICKKLSKEENVAEENGGAPKYVDLNAVLEELKRKEAKWGGSVSLIGSPKDEDSLLDVHTIGKVVYRHLVKKYKYQARFQVAKSPVAPYCNINEIWVDENLFGAKTNLLDRKLQSESFDDVIDLINRGVNVSTPVEKVSRDSKKTPITPFEKYISGILYRSKIKNVSANYQVNILYELGMNMQRIAREINPNKLFVMQEIFASLSDETRNHIHIKNIRKLVNGIVSKRKSAIFGNGGKGE